MACSDKTDTKYPNLEHSACVINELRATKDTLYPFSIRDGPLLVNRKPHRERHSNIETCTLCDCICTPQVIVCKLLPISDVRHDRFAPV